MIIGQPLRAKPNYRHRITVAIFSFVVIIPFPSSGKAVPKLHLIFMSESLLYSPPAPPHSPDNTARKRESWCNCSDALSSNLHPHPHHPCPTNPSHPSGGGGRRHRLSVHG